ncbi:Disease resistance protein [Corchorus olitorius]|uniref:Disease resistance protein n=1 Tax=Corchorus olitorius TaxID=93759 RepID=A0A1R3HM94_9ROSI|nr:Disease resistance protein [Corchorus olitorius]
MAEIATSVAAGVAENLVEQYAVNPTLKHVRYVFCFESIVGEFRDQKQNFSSALSRMKHSVEEAKRRKILDIYEDVKEWIKKADNIENEVESLEMEIQENKTCFSWCPNWSCRYRLSKKIARKTLEMMGEVERSSKFDPNSLGHAATLPKTAEFLSTEDFLLSKSSESVLKRIWKELGNNGNYLIGVRGMGGVGKTTLAKQVVKKAEEEKLFDAVVFTIVSQNPNIDELQDDVAGQLGLEFDKKSGLHKAKQLWLRLKNEERVLIILDDIWSPIDLKAIGFPIGDDHAGCKLLLTTREKEVCDQMDCKMIELGFLDEDEAWDLFQKNADLTPAESNNEHIDLELAREVARECRALPLAIVTVARALKRKSEDAWKLALNQLKECRHSDTIDFYEYIYTRLRISYDCLKDQLKSCFLLCSLFPEDFDISIEDLTRYGIGLGLLPNDSSIDYARTSMRVNLQTLQNSALLLKGRKDNCVKMHDVVRDFGHWIMYKEKKLVLVRAGQGLKAWPRNVTFDSHMAISLMNNKIDRLPCGLQCPKLETLLLSGDGSTKVSSEFFQGMKALRVVMLEGVLLSLDGLHFMENLRTLRLQNCKLENVSSLGDLKKLEILDLRASYIYELPIELKELTELRLLDLSGCGMLQRIPRDLLPKLLSLEELYMDYPSFDQWTADEENIAQGSNASLKELNRMRLNALTLCVRSNCLSEYDFPNLERYAIVVNRWQNDHYPTSKTLKIKDSSLDAFKNLLPKVEDLSLDSIAGYNNLIPKLDPRGLRELTFLELQDCKDMECLLGTTADEMPAPAFSKLMKLTMNNMVSFRQLCNGQPPKEFLQNLKELTVRNCMDMISAVPGVQNLRNVTITNCVRLKAVFETDTITKKESKQLPLLSNLANLELESLPELWCIWKGVAHHHVRLQSLKVVRVQHCDKLTSFFSPSLAQSLIELEDLEILHCPELKQIIADYEEDNEISANSSLESLCLPKLTTIRIIDCSKLEYVFPMSMAEGLPKLKSLCIIDSSQLQQIFSSEKGNDEKDIALSQLQSLVLQNLKKLKSFCPENCIVTLTSLVELKVYKCPQLTHFTGQLPTKAWGAQLKELYLFKVGHNSQLYNRIGSRLRQSSSDSEYLTIGNCQEIFQLQGGYLLSSLSALHLEDLSELKVIWKGPMQVATLQNLKNLVLINCKSLRYVFPPMLSKNLSNLNFLCIKDCEALEQIIHDDQSSTSSSNAPVQPTSFPGLRKIWIIGCKKLKILFPISVAHRLFKLEELKVEEASELEQIFGNEGETDLHKDKKEIVLPQLKRLFLRKLPCLTRFITECYHFMFPTLEYLEVKECSKITTSFLVDSEYYTHAQMKESSCLFNMRNWSQHCDAIVPGQKSSHFQHMSVDQNHKRTHQVQGGHNLSSLRVLRLETLPGLRIIWRDLVQQVTLQNLITLKVIGCKSLRHVFSATIAKSLLHLKHLKIWGCDTLEQIIAADQISSSEVHPQACFPELTKLQIGRCQNLKRLFAASCLAHLSKLRYLIVEEAFELEHLFGHEDEESSQRGQEKKIVLPQLEVLFLGKLPSLLSSSPQGYHFIFQSLRSLTVEECPKIASTFSVDSNLYVHAITEASQLVEKGAMKSAIAIQGMEDTTNGSTKTTKDTYWYRWYQPNELPQYTEVVAE